MGLLHVPTLTLQEAAPFHSYVPYILQHVPFKTHKHTVILVAPNPTFRRETGGKASGSLECSLEGRPLSQFGGQESLLVFFFYIPIPSSSEISHTHPSVVKWGVETWERRRYPVHERFP